MRIFSGNLERAAGSWQTILVQPHSHFAEALPLFIFGLCFHSRVSDSAAASFFFFVHVRVCLHGPGVHPSASAREREASIPREMCFLVAEAGTPLVAG